MTSIPMGDLAWQHRQVRAEIDRAIDRFLTDPTCDAVPLVQALEQHVSKLLGGVHAVGVQSGLAAQFLTMIAYGIGPGDEVITVPNSDLATNASISQTGASFVMVDIDPRTFNIDPALIEAAITPRTRAIVPVHMYGLPAEMTPILEIAHRHNLLVIEDATLALGASYHGTPAGTLGDAGFFSFAPGKVIGGTGNGAIVVTRDAELVRKIDLLRAYGIDPDRFEARHIEHVGYVGRDHLVEGYNRKLDGLQAAIVLAKLQKLDDWAARRQAIADRYAEHFADAPEIVTPFVPSHVQHSWRNYVVRVPERDAIRERMRERGISTGVLYAPPVHLQTVYSDRGFKVGDFPHSEAVARDLLALPMHPGLELEQADIVASALIEEVRQAGGVLATGRIRHGD